MLLREIYRRFFFTRRHAPSHGSSAKCRYNRRHAARFRGRCRIFFSPARRRYRLYVYLLGMHDALPKILRRQNDAADAASFCFCRHLRCFPRAPTSLSITTRKRLFHFSSQLFQVAHLHHCKMDRLMAIYLANLGSTLVAFNGGSHGFGILRLAHELLRPSHCQDYIALRRNRIRRCLGRRHRRIHIFDAPSGRMTGEMISTYARIAARDAADAHIKYHFARSSAGHISAPQRLLGIRGLRHWRDAPRRRCAHSISVYAALGLKSRHRTLTQFHFANRGHPMQMSRDKALLP